MRVNDFAGEEEFHGLFEADNFRKPGRRHRGKTPTAISGCPILDFSEATTISQKAMSSQPPPRDLPFTTATVVTSILCHDPEHAVEHLDHFIYFVSGVVCHIDAIAEGLFARMIENEQLDCRVFLDIHEDLD